MSKADIGLIGLAVMGQNLVLNMNDHGFTVAVFNRTTSKVDKFLETGARGTKVIGTHSLGRTCKFAGKSPARNVDGAGWQSCGRFYRNANPASCAW